MDHKERIIALESGGGSGGTPIPFEIGNFSFTWISSNTVKNQYLTGYYTDTKVFIASFGFEAIGSYVYVYIKGFLSLIYP